MNMATLVLQVLLGLVFLPLSFLALRQHETDWYGTFLVASGPFASSAMVLASQKLRERILFRPETHCVLVLRTHPVGPVVKCFETETTPTDIEGLDGCGFTTEEIVSLLWLQHWYQTGGSDRVEPLRQWEFLKYLVLNGKLGR
jgi:hypothetical protein